MTGSTRVPDTAQGEFSRIEAVLDAIRAIIAAARPARTRATRSTGRRQITVTLDATYGDGRWRTAPAVTRQWTRLSSARIAEAEW